MVLHHNIIIYITIIIIPIYGSITAENRAARFKALLFLQCLERVTTSSVHCNRKERLTLLVQGHEKVCLAMLMNTGLDNASDKAEL